MTKNRIAAVGLLVAALGLVLWLVGGFINNPAVTAALSGVGLTLAALGVVAALVGFALRLIR